MARRASGSIAITVRGRDRQIEVELEGRTMMVRASTHLWELQEVLASCEPEHIFLDLHLPITFGVELMRVLREAYPDVPITTKVETNLSGSHYFSIEAERRGIVLKPVSPQSADAFPVEKE